MKDRAGKERKLSPRGGKWSPKGDVLLVAFDHDLWLLAEGEQPKRLTNDPDDEESPTFSPDGSRVAYVKKSDLFTLELATGMETRLTTTGTEHVLNGRLDWVYEEELANRRGSRSYEWAPDSSAIAYLRLDENRVPSFPVVDFVPVNGKVVPQRYPKAGDPNAIPSVHVVDLTGRETASFAPADDDVYVAPELAWTADGKQACFLLLDRPQTTLDVLLLPRTGGAPKKLLDGDGPRVDQRDRAAALPHRRIVRLPFRADGLPAPLPHAADGTLVERHHEGRLDGRRAVVRGREDGTVWFRATTKDPRERQVFVAKLDGSSMIQRARKSRDPFALVRCRTPALLRSTYSNVATPPRTV